MSPEEVSALVNDVRDRVRERHARQTPELPDFEMPELEPLGRARDLADGKVAAIGTVNPRRPGLVNDLIQAVKKTVARSLNWMLRDQVEFNRAVVAYMDRQIETQVEYNYNLLRVARDTAQVRADLVHRMDSIDGAIAEIRDSLAETREIQSDTLKHWTEWRPAFEEKLSKTEVYFLHAVREIEGELRKREETFRSDWLELHKNYEGSLSAASDEIQKKLWADLEALKAEQERMIQTELRVLRRKASLAAPAPATTSAPAAAPAPAPAVTPAAGLDYARFEERFRGDEAFVAQNQQFYLPVFDGKSRVIDLGCGRGELLHMLSERGADVLGVDLDAEALEACREKGLAVEQRRPLRVLEPPAGRELRRSILRARGGTPAGAALAGVGRLGLRQAAPRRRFYAGNAESRLPGNFCRRLLPRPHTRKARAGCATAFPSGRGRVRGDRDPRAASRARCLPRAPTAGRE